MVLRIIGASNGGNVIFKLKQPLRELYAYTMKSAPRDSRRALIKGLDRDLDIGTNGSMDG